MSGELSTDRTSLKIFSLGDPPLILREQFSVTMLVLRGTVIPMEKVPLASPALTLPVYC